MRSPARAVWAYRNGYMKDRQRRLRAARIPLLVACLAAVLATSALAYFLAVGAGSGSASVSTLGAPTITEATPGAGTVSLTWSSVPPPLGAGTVTYHVSRDGGAAGGTCPTAAAPTTATSCVDAGVAPGVHSYTVTARWRTWTATSPASTVTVVAAIATHFVLSTPTATFPAGQAQNLTITAKDASGNTATAYAGAKSLTFTGAGTVGANSPTVTDVLGTPRSFGTAESILFVGGVATVTAGTNGAMTLYKAETASIVVSDGAISNGAGLPVTVTAAAASKLEFTKQPSTANAAVAFGTQPEVTVRDTYGNTATTNTGNVTLSIGTNPGAGTLSCAANPRAASAGVASFSGCSINRPGTGYTLTATSGLLTPATSAAFNIIAAPLWIASGSTVERTSSGALVPPLPGSIALNDLMLAIVVNTKKSTSSAPLGWATLGSVENGAGDEVGLTVLYRFYQLGVLAPSIDVSTDAGGATARIVTYRYVNTTTPLAASAVTSISGKDVASFTPTGLTTGTANALALSIVAENDSVSTPPTLTLTSPQGFTLAGGFPDAPSGGNNSNHHAVILAGKPMPAPGPVVFPTHGTNFAGSWAGISAALRP